MIEPMEKMPPEDAPYILPSKVWDDLWTYFAEAECECDDSTGHTCEACSLVRKLEALKPAAPVQGVGTTKEGNPDGK